MKLTKTALELKKIVDEHGTNHEERQVDVDNLATCMGSEGEEWIYKEEKKRKELLKNWIKQKTLLFRAFV